MADSHISEIGSIVSAACLAHDLGNPPFGHSGEKAISTYFSEEMCIRDRSFNESELGKLHSVFPFECMAKAAGLSDRRLGRCV